VRASTYANAGVDINDVAKIHSLLARRFTKSFEHRRGRFGQVVGGIGHYAGLIDIGGDRLLAIHVDGVGTKVLVAQMVDKGYESLGIDCVAMCANDLICLGSEPICLVDYIALKRVDEALVDQLAKGLLRGAEEARMAVVGGETAIVPDMIGGVGSNGFDIAATGLGLVNRDRVIDGSKLNEGDAIIGVSSSGVHSNGLSLARKSLFSKFAADDTIDGFDHSLGEELLVPTRIYVKPVLEIIQRYEINGLAHITGGAFSKLTRIGKKARKGFKLDRMPRSQPIFQLIQKMSRVNKKEMYRTFNMGIGFCVCAPKKDAENIIDLFEKNKMKSQIVGTVIKNPGVYLGSLRLDNGIPKISN